MLIAINRHLIDKASQDALKQHHRAFDNLDLSARDLAECINQGVAFCGQQRDGWRKQAHFIGAGFLAVDIDHGLTLDAAQADAFYQAYGTILYTTPSHTPDNHRFRILFELEQPITDPAVMRDALTGLISRFGADGACKDPSRLFFGCRNSQPTVQDRTLPASVVQELVCRGREVCVHRETRDSSQGEKGPRPGAVRSILVLPRDREVRTERGELRLLRDLAPYTRIFCPQHADRNPSAFILRSQTGNPGVYCSACHATYFLDDGTGTARGKEYRFDYRWDRYLDISPDEYEFHADDEGVVDLGKLRGVDLHSTHYLPFEESPVVVYPKPDVAAIKRLEQDGWVFDPEVKNLEGFIPEHEITLIKSPKGTGKTEWLGRLVNDCKAVKLKVLLIGHRRSLITATAARLGLTCYLWPPEQPGDRTRYHPPTPYYAICVDSLATRIDPKTDHYDVVLIDEVEQVFAHLLSPTMKEHRRKVLHTLMYYVNAAKALYVLDADLERITLEGLFAMIENIQKKPCKIILNRWRPDRRGVHLYDSKDALLGELVQSLERGERCFVCANSKRFIDALAPEITKHLTRDVRTISLTSDNCQQPEIQDFIRNIKARALEYDAIFTSPVLGTGVDITFPGDAPGIDTVFGFFEARVNTHFDIDQQLSRVRNPRGIKVWISPEEFQFETDLEAIKTELIAAEQDHAVFLGFNPDGSPRYLRDELYETVFATVTAAQRASKNRLRSHFIDLRTSNGWEVETVAAPNATVTARGREVREAGKAEEEHRRHMRILKAKAITAAEYGVLKRADQAEQLTEDGRFEMRRYELEVFYHQDADIALLKLDDDGKFRQAVRNYERLMTRDDELRGKDQYSDRQLVGDRSNYLPQKTLFVALLQASGLFSRGQFNPEAVIGAKHLSGFAEVCLTRKPEIERLFNLPVRRNVLRNPVQQLNALLKLLGLKVDKHHETQQGGKKLYFYQLNPGHLQTVSEWAVRRADDGRTQTWTQAREAPQGSEEEDLPTEDPVDDPVDRL